MMQRNFLLSLAVIGIESCCLFFIVWIWASPPLHQSKRHGQQQESDRERESRGEGMFFEIAKQIGTDKVSPSHSYQRAYERYLSALRDTPLRLVEIGLGCDMQYGAGKSFRLWDAYLTNPEARVYFIEKDAACGVRWNSVNPRISIFVGDQSDEQFLRTFVEETGGHFDVIIDDGGHTMVQQTKSLFELFPALKSGGFYFIEDLATSYIEGYGGGYQKPETTIEMFKRILDGFHRTDPNLPPIMDLIASFHCFPNICVLEKK